MYILWTILGTIFLFLEHKKTSSLKLSIAATFLFCAIVAYKFPNNYLYQGLGFVGFGLTFYFLINKSLKKEEQEKLKEKNLNNDYIGKKAIVIKDIGKAMSIDGLGYIKYKNMLWSAKNINDKLIKAGTKVEIVSKENKIMNVKVINETNI